MPSESGEYSTVIIWVCEFCREYEFPVRMLNGAETGAAPVSKPPPRFCTVNESFLTRPKGTDPKSRTRLETAISGAVRSWRETTDWLVVARRSGSCFGLETGAVCAAATQVPTKRKAVKRPNEGHLIANSLLHSLISSYDCLDRSNRR